VRSKDKATGPITDDQELWLYNHALSRQIQRPLEELNEMLSEAAKQGVLVNVKVERTKSNAPFIDASVFSSD
jgi:hypothetical protein